MAEAANQAENLDEVVGAVTRLTTMLVGAVTCSVWLREQEGDGFELADAVGLDDLPPAAGTLTGLGWSDDERTLYVRTSTGAWRVAAPPLPPEPRPVTDAERAAADSALMTLLGTPRFASAAPCDSGGVCITGADGTPRRVDPDGRAPFRWGSDSVAWLVGDRVAIRPLGPGPVRRLDPDLTRISGITGASYASP